MLNCIIKVFVFLFKLILVLLCLSIIALPIIILLSPTKEIISIPLTVKDNAWLSFFGSYIGGIFAATATVITVFILHKQNKALINQNQKLVDHNSEMVDLYNDMVRMQYEATRLSIKPSMDIKDVSGRSILYSEINKPVSISDTSEKKYSLGEEHFQYEIIIKNCGKGSAHKVSSRIEKVKASDQWYMVNQKNNIDSYIEKDKEVNLRIVSR